VKLTFILSSHSHASQANFSACSLAVLKAGIGTMSSSTTVFLAVSHGFLSLAFSGHSSVINGPRNLPDMVEINTAEKKMVPGSGPDEMTPKEVTEVIGVTRVIRATGVNGMIDPANTRVDQMIGPGPHRETLEDNIT
jgi:hypothetical protein